MYPRVPDECDVLRDRRRERADRFARVAGARSGQSEHRPVVVGVCVHVEQRRAASLRERPQHDHVAAFRDVRDALQHPVSVGASR